MTNEAISEATLDLTNRAGKVVGSLTVSCLAGNLYWNDVVPQLLDTTSANETDPTAAPIQLLEDCEYRYEIVGVESVESLQPKEALNPDDQTWLTGRLRPGRRTGSLLVEVEVQDQRATAELEVRSRKLNYLQEYRWMLQRVADEATELLLQQFAASRLRTLQPSSGDSETLYAKFAFVAALLNEDSFEGSLQQILRRPDHAYLQFEESVHPSRGLRASRSLSRELVAPGRRVALPAGRTVGGGETIPERVSRVVHQETLDTIPNRFVLYALRSWRNLAEQVLDALGDVDSAAATRGRREATYVRERMERILSNPLFADVGPLDHFPSSNQVLQRRDGYRDVYRAFLQGEVASALTWEGGEDLFGAGQRDVATLYEYWTFLELARVIESIPGFQMDRRGLFKLSKDEMSLNLGQGRSTVLKGHGHMRGRRLDLKLWYNKEFFRPHGSWSGKMTPDCSLRITPVPAITSAPDTWLHFDAKYRVDSYKKFFESGDDHDEPLEVVSSRPMGDDLTKMHAYRDAIRRTAGAYVLYPGADEEALDRRQYHEILPGLGAFVMRPTESGALNVTVESAMRKFIVDVMDHIAAGGTSWERAEFWTQESYADRGEAIEFEDLLKRPAADTKVLLGYVKDDAHLAWIQRTNLYNMRADDERQGSIGLESPELGTDVVILYNDKWEAPYLLRPTGAFYVKTRTQMVELNYPRPGGQRYLCVELGPQIATTVSVDLERVLALTRSRTRQSWGSPFVVTWSRLVEPVSSRA